MGFLGAGGALPHEVTSLHDLASGQGTRKVEWGAGLRPGAVEVSMTTRLRLPGGGEPCGGGRVRDPCGGKGGLEAEIQQGNGGASASPAGRWAGQLRTVKPHCSPLRCASLRGPGPPHSGTHADLPCWLELGL